MVAASKLRRAQERMMNARPYAQQMQRVLASVASRVDPSIHPLLTVSRTPAEQHHARHCRDRATRGSAAASTPTSSRARRATSRAAARPARSVSWAGKAAISSAGAASRWLFEQVGIFQKLRFDDAQTIARTAIDAFVGEQVDRVVLVYNEFKSVMTQRVVDRSAAADRPRGRRGPGRVALAAIRSTTCTNRRRRRSSTSCCRATSRRRSTGRCSNRTRRSSPRR